MTVIREQFDGEGAEQAAASMYRSAMNRFEISCSVCGRRPYVGEDTKREIQRALDRDLDNTLVCSECERDADMIGYE